MSTVRLPKVLKAFDLWIENESYAGTCTKVKLPDLKRKFEAMAGGGLSREIKIDVGGEAMELEYDISGLSTDLIKSYASNKIDGVYLAFFGSLESDDGSNAEALEVHAWGRYEELGFGDQEFGKLGSTTAKMAVDRIKIVLNSKTMLEDDPRNMRLVVNGVDLYEKRRKALGRA